MSTEILLSDAETCIVASYQHRNALKAREAHDFVDMYFIARDDGEPEPWNGADGDARDIERQSVILENLYGNRRGRKKAMPVPDIWVDQLPVVEDYLRHKLAGKSY